MTLNFFSKTRCIFYLFNTNRPSCIWRIQCFTRWIYVVYYNFRRCWFNVNSQYMSMTKHCNYNIILQWDSSSSSLYWKMWTDIDKGGISDVHLGLFTLCDKSSFLSSIEAIQIKRHGKHRLIGSIIINNGQRPRRNFLISPCTASISVSATRVMVSFNHGSISPTCIRARLSRTMLG